MVQSMFVSLAFPLFVLTTPNVSRILFINRAGRQYYIAGYSFPAKGTKLEARVIYSTMEVPCDTSSKMVTIDNFAIRRRRL